MNENNQTPQITEQDLNNLATEIKKDEAPNQKLFKEIVQATNLPEEKLKEAIPNLDKVGKNDRIEPIKTASDQEKISAYDRLEVKDLPFDWKLQLARNKELEKNTADYLQKKEELKVWTDTFNNEKPIKVHDDIESLEIELEKTKEDSESKITDLENKLASVSSEKDNIIQKLTDKVKELEQELKEWKTSFSSSELAKVKEEWQVLQQRPDLSISENEFYDDYARRKSKEQSEKEAEKLLNAKQKISELEQEKQRFLTNIKKIEENWRSQRYNLSKPVINSEQAQKAIAELLEKTLKEWESYLEGESQNPILTLSFQVSEKKEKAYQILEWIKEAKASQNYQKLFKLWSGGDNYNKEFDFDGSLYLLGKYLEVRD